MSILTWIDKQSNLMYSTYSKYNGKSSGRDSTQIDAEPIKLVSDHSLYYIQWKWMKHPRLRQGQVYQKWEEKGMEKKKSKENKVSMGDQRFGAMAPEMIR